jgi:hypothetical protein
MTAPRGLDDLGERFARGLQSYKSGAYNETQVLGSGLRYCVMGLGSWHDKGSRNADDVWPATGREIGRGPR